MDNLVRSVTITRLYKRPYKTNIIEALHTDIEYVAILAVGALIMNPSQLPLLGTICWGIAVVMYVWTGASAVHRSVVPK